MTNSTSASMHSVTQGYPRTARKGSDAAPMVVTRLSGWIDVGEAKSEVPAWIIQTSKAKPA